MIDLHSHVLAGLDDGARTLEETIAMLRWAAAAGTTDIVASPHANDRFRFDPTVVEAKIAEAQAAAGGRPRVHYGCDLHLSPENVQAALAHPEHYAINHKRYLLVEFSDLGIPRDTAQIFDRLRGAGLLPVVTHPERNHLLRGALPDLVEWVEAGCFLQVTAQSFLGRFGRQARAFAEELARQGLAHFVASDAHDAEDRPPGMNLARDRVAQRFGERSAVLLFSEHPRAALLGEPLPFGRLRVSPRRRWYHLSL